MRHMTDQEWFASLSRKKKRVPYKPRVPTAFKPNLANPTTWMPGQMKPDLKVDTDDLKPGQLNRSVSSSSVNSMLSPEEVVERAESMRKRDRLLRRLSRHKGSVHGDHMVKQDPDGDTHHLRARDGKDPAAEAAMPDGERQLGGMSNDPLDVDDASAGSYVNYEIGFEYKQPKEAQKKRGLGLHVLVSQVNSDHLEANHQAYFGIGLKGVGRSEFRRSTRVTFV
jgi:hypothetical protein